MADEVRIILKGSSKQLEASITRIAAGLRGLQTQSVVTNRVMQKGAQRTSKSINNQNKSFTLMVAKLALVTFAVQTLANIINSTFGAVLKNIDDFNVAAIGTAAAVTSIANVSEDAIGKAFNKNLNAALATFEELEIVAANFFSTGQELQLAFNTLAQRGVIIRQDEFNILGKITDQIKLLTGGQNTQIQIQQELRAILDGNVRTTTAFGKSLQARGVDVAQLSKEIRATGSLQPFEPFLKGLDAAGPAIRRTLSSVTATFSSLFQILQRNIFQDTFDGIVSSITELNNLIIDQRDTIIQVGIFIKSEISDAWDGVVGILDKISATILRIIQNDLVQFGAAIVIIGKLARRGPLGALLALATAFAGVSGEVSTFGNVITIVINSFALGLEFLLNGLELIASTIGNIAERIQAGFSGGIDFSVQVGELQDAENRVNEITKAVTILQRRANRLQLIPDRTLREEEQLQDTLQNRLALIKEFENASTTVGSIQDVIRSTDVGAEFLAGRQSGIDDSLRKTFAEVIKDLANATDEVASDLLSDTKEEASKLLDELKNLASGTVIPARTTGSFTDTKTRNEINRKIIDAQLAAQAKADDEVSKARIKAADRELRVTLANIKTAQAADGLTGRQAFDLTNKANEARRAAAIEELEIQKDILKFRTQQSINVVEATDKESGANLAGLTTQEQKLAILKLQTNEVTKKAILDEKIAAIGNKGALAQLEIQRDITLEVRKANELLAKRQGDIAAFGGQTNRERAEQINRESDLRQQAFNRTNVDPAQQERFAGQERLIKTQQAIENQVTAIVGAIEAAFDTIIDGILEGSFKFRDLAQTVSKDLIKSGLDGLIKEIQSAVGEGMTKLFESAGVAGAQKAAQALTLALGLILAIISKVGSKGDFTASGAASGSGIDQSSLPTRGLIGGDTSLPIAQINEGLLEAMLPTNAILATIERNTRPLAGLGELSALDLSQLISDRIDAAFSQSLLTP